MNSAGSCVSQKHRNRLKVGLRGVKCKYFSLDLLHKHHNYKILLLWWERGIKTHEGVLMPFVSEETLERCKPRTQI